MTIRDLDPSLVWKNFYALTQIPRPSKKEGKAVEYLYGFGKSLGLETIKDEVGNIIIKKPATPGMEGRRGVILQGHIDMVPQKNADKVHDFEKDPITTLVDGDWVRADGTTLGADNGLGVAVALSVLESRDLKHGPVEVLVTVDEETGMTGANALKPGLLDGDILINLDSETEGELYVGCAGGLDATASLKYEMKPAPAGYKAYRISAKGMKGGHSGMDIILYRANANKVLARVLVPLLRDGVKLVSVDGGNMRNAIPREAFADVLVPEGMVSAVESHIASVQKDIRNEYAATDPDAGLLNGLLQRGEQLALPRCIAFYVGRGPGTHSQMGKCTRKGLYLAISFNISGKLPSYCIFHRAPPLRSWPRRCAGPLLPQRPPPLFPRGGQRQRG